MPHVNRPVFRLAALATLLALGASRLAQAQTVFQGTLAAGDPTFALASSTADAVLNPLALYNGVHPYNVFSFQLNAADSVTFQMNGQVVGANAALIDPSIAIYEGYIAPGSFSGFNATTAPAYRGGNDDIINGTQRNSLVTLNLDANTTYTVILTTWQSDLGLIQYGESQYGGYEATLLTTTALLSPIPEPTTYGLLLGGATLGLVGWRRWRRSAPAYS